MALLSDEDYSGIELLDLFLEPQKTSSGERVCVSAVPAALIVNQSTVFPGEGVSENFLDSLLEATDVVSNSCSPLCVPSPSDSGISDDTPSDHLDSPLSPASPLFESIFFPPHPNLQLQHLQQPPDPQGSPVTKTEPDFSIDLADWESCLFSDTVTDPQCVWRNQATPIYQLSVKDLLLSRTTEPIKPPTQQSPQELSLNEDEKKLLAKEGVSLPTQLPLSKYEDKMLKKIRRKIRNKQSAQESRKKKKDYVDGLEGRVAACSAQNVELQRKVLQLEKANTSLIEQLRRLQALVMGSSNKPVQTGSCILVLVLSFSLLLIPSLQPISHRRTTDLGDFSLSKVQSRSLRSVMEVYDQQVDKTRLKEPSRNEYADMDLGHILSYRVHKLHHSDPITGHTAKTDVRIVSSEGQEVMS